MTLSRLLLLLRTARYLKPGQVVWRVRRKLVPAQFRPVDTPAMRSVPPEWRGAARFASMTGPVSFRFLNREETLSGPSSWNDPTLPKLWLYNLHYFDDLLAESAGERTVWHRDLIPRWIRENPAPHGNGWEPYPTSLRIINWIRWAWSGHTLPDTAVENLANQANCLSRNLEYHLLGNHLFANAKALIFAGTFFEGPLADCWRMTGINILRKELPEQTLQNGGHFERSTIYHSLFVEDLLDLVQLARLTGAIPDHDIEHWKSTAARALAWLDGLTHPDGGIAFFNDAAFGIAPESKALQEYAARQGLAAAPSPAPDFDDYIRLESGPAVLLCDTAPIGPDYLPGHAHADSLSFEFSLAGHRMIANGGTSVYGGDPALRLVERSTEAHNTVTVDGQSSSEVWAEFRVARRAHIKGRSINATNLPAEVAATHDGFRRFGGPSHKRRWELGDTHLTIEDELTGAWKRATARIRLVPPFSFAEGRIDGPTPVSVKVDGGTLRHEPGHWAREFGVRVPCDILCIDFTGPRLTTTLTWEA
ncbi:MAG: alginate lyase family protein [Pseudomonadota bacterium]